MKTKCIAIGGLEDGFAPTADERKNEAAQLHYAAGKFFIKRDGKSALKRISSREAVTTFIRFINNGETDSYDLAPLIKAIKQIGIELPFAKDSKIPWRN